MGSPFLNLLSEVEAALIRTEESSILLQPLGAARALPSTQGRNILTLSFALPLRTMYSWSH